MKRLLMLVGVAAVAGAMYVAAAPGSSQSAAPPNGEAVRDSQEAGGEPEQEPEGAEEGRGSGQEGGGARPGIHRGLLLRQQRSARKPTGEPVRDHQRRLLVRY